MEYDLTWLQVDLDVLAENMRLVRQKAGTDVLAVVKADAYGMGAVTIAHALQDSCAFLGTANISEALELRRSGIEKPILILGRMPVSAYPLAVREGIRMPIFLYEDAKALSDEAVKQGKTARFHFALDTGMSRIGFQVTEADADICQEICKLPGLQAEGLFSHFATADNADLTRAKAQAERFRTFDAMLKTRGVEIPIRHLDNSAGILNFDTHYEMVRAGIILYGLEPSSEVDITGLQPALRWYSRVTHIKTLEPGRQIGYGGTFAVTKPTRVATVPVGYADGTNDLAVNYNSKYVYGKTAADGAKAEA